MKKFLNKNGLRKLIQLSILGVVIYWLIRSLLNPDLLINFEAYCPMGGIQSLFTLIQNGALACTMTGMQLILGIALMISTLLFSKLFCGYLCPLGTIGEWFSKIGKKFKIQINVSEHWDKILRLLKYALLSITLYYTLLNNELYCKSYDPFFAIASRFGHDVIPWMAISALILLAIGSAVIPMFWCRYICPLGAVSNLLKHIYIVIALVLIYLVTFLFDLQVSWIYLLIILFITAYLFETIIPEKSKHIHMLKITRNINSCVDCGLCSQVCPQGIDVASLEVVNHADCNMCGECLSSCPQEDTLRINNNNKFRWTPIIALGILVLSGIYLGTKLEIPTVDLKWGTSQEMKQSKFIEYSGLKNVKCYGSSMSFVNQMKSIEGITGAATYTNSHSVKVWYDTTTISSTEVQKALFSPVKVHIKDAEDSIKLAVIDIKIYNFFDQMDVFYLEQKLRKTNEVMTFETSFGEPVNVKIYTDYNIDLDTLKQIIEKPYVTIKSGDTEYEQSTNFKIGRIERLKEYTTGLDLKRGTFLPYKTTFNGYKNYSKSQFEIMEIGFKSYPRNKQMLPFLLNYVGKKDTFTVGAISYYKTKPTLRIYYIKDKTTSDNIVDLLTDDKIEVTYNNGVKETIDNPYTFE